MKRTPLVALVAATVALASLGLAACTPKGRYVDLVFASATKTTQVYKETTHLVTGEPLDLYADIYQPKGDTAARRPAIIWIHGGGFTSGDRSAMADVATAYARRGYVTLSISYRLDPGLRCQDLQDGSIPPEELDEVAARCRRAITAASNDGLSAVGWLRRHADEYRVDQKRIAIGGSSAGAVTAVNVGQRANPGGGPIPSGQSVGAVLAMSGCQYDGASIDRYDAPVSMLASGGDSLVPYSCSVGTVRKAASFGTPTQELFYPSESWHAQGLYARHRAEVDAAWTSFLIRQLDLA